MPEPPIRVVRQFDPKTRRVNVYEVRDYLDRPVWQRCQVKDGLDGAWIPYQEGGYFPAVTRRELPRVGDVFEQYDADRGVKLTFRITGVSDTGDVKMTVGAGLA